MSDCAVNDIKTLQARYRLRLAAESIASIDLMLRQVEAMIAALCDHVRLEEVRTRIRDPKHIAYSTLALAARTRLDKLQKTRHELLAALARTTREHHLASMALGHLETPKEPSAPIVLPRERDILLNVPPDHTAL